MAVLRERVDHPAHVADAEVTVAASASCALAIPLVSRRAGSRRLASAVSSVTAFDGSIFNTNVLLGT